jgi:Flp pilus assembly protein TadD
MPSTKPLLPLLCCLALLLGGCANITPLLTGEKATQSAGKTVSGPLQRSYDAALQSLRQGELEQAKRQFKAMAEENPQLSGPLTNIGIILLKQEQPAAAEQALREALERNPKSAPAHNQLGVALRMQGRFAEAEQAYQSALEIEPVYLLAHRNLGILYDLYLAKPAQALEQYRLCQKLATEPDKEIEGWILDLERRTKGAK